MIVFYTSQTKHLASSLPFECGKYVSKQLSDGEQYVKLGQDVTNKKVWVIAATNPPAEHLVELWLLLNALERAQAQVFLLFTYFGYARQDDPLEGEASSAEMMSKIFGLFSLKKIIVIHAHSQLLHKYLRFEDIVPIDLICQTAQLYDAIAAPDQGAYELVKLVAQRCNIEPIFLTKIRPEQEMVKILEYDGIVRARRILIIDDIIATGNTIIEVAKILTKLGATDVNVWATHGIFSANAIAALQESVITKIFVTNTLPQKHTDTIVEVINIAQFLEQIIRSE